jgi:hypothetical protein
MRTAPGPSFAATGAPLTPQLRRTPLFIAAARGDEEMMALLFEHGADVSAVDEVSRLKPQ